MTGRAGDGVESLNTHFLFDGSRRQMKKIDVR